MVEALAERSSSTVSSFPLCTGTMSVLVLPLMVNGGVAFAPTASSIYQNSPNEELDFAVPPRDDASESDSHSV